MALSRTEQILAGAVCLGILALYVKSGKDKDEEIADGAPPDDHYPMEKLKSVEAELREIINRVQQVEKDARGTVAEWEFAARLPASPDVMGQVTRLAKQLDGVTLRANALFPQLPRAQTKRIADWQNFKNQVRDHIDRILRVGEQAARPISLTNNVAHISTVYKDVGGTQTYNEGEQNLTQNFMQQTFEGPQVEEHQHLTINQQQDVRMINFAEGFTDPQAPGAAVGPPASGGFMQIQDGPRQSDDRQVAVTQDGSGLNATGPKAPSQAVQPYNPPTTLPDSGGFGPMQNRVPKKTGPLSPRHTAKGTQLTIEGGFTQAPQSQVAIIPPVASQSSAPPQVPIGNAVVRYGEAPDFNPAQTAMVPHEFALDVAERKNYGTMGRDGYEGTAEAKQLKRKIDNRQAIEDASRLQEQLGDNPVFAATNQKTDQYYGTFAKSLQNEKNDAGKEIVKKRMTSLWNVTPAGMTLYSFRNVYMDKYIQGDAELSASDIKMRPDYKYWKSQVERARPQYRAFQEKRTADDAGLAPMTGGSGAKKARDRKLRLRRLLAV